MDSNLLVSILFFVGAAQGLLLSVALFSLRRGNRTANRILSALLLLFSFMIFFHASAQLQHPSQSAREEEWFAHAIFLLFGPLLYHYVKALTQRGFVLTGKATLHLIPFIVLFSLYLINAQQPLPDRFADSLNILMPWLMMLQMLVYLLSCVRMLRGHSRTIRERFSSLDRINLRWLQFIIFAQTIIWPIAFLAEVFKSGPSEINIMWLMISFFMYGVGYFGIRQPEIFAGELQEEDRPSRRGKRKYDRSALPAEMAETILQRLESYMRSAKPFLDTELSLPSMAKQLSVSTHHLSQTINEKTGKNFFDFVNEYRVEEAKRLLVDRQFQHLTLAAIGLEAGFNSVSAFNSVFKKQTTLTPSQYRSSAMSTDPQNS